MFVKGVNLCNTCTHRSFFDGCSADNNIVNFEYEPDHEGGEVDDE